MKAVKIGLGVSLFVNFVLGVMWLNSQKETVRETVLTTPTLRQESTAKKNTYEIASARFKEGSFKTIQIQFSSALAEFGESVVRVAGKKHGALRWTGSHEAELDLDQALRTEESVSLSLVPELCPQGWVSGDKQTLNVQTEGFKLVSFEQIEVDRAGSIIRLEFNSNCIKEDLAKYLIAYAGGMYIDWSFRKVQGRICELFVKKVHNDQFSLQVKKGMKNAYGSTLVDDVQKSFKTVEDLRITRVEAKRTYQNEFLL